MLSSSFEKLCGQSFFHGLSTTTGFTKILVGSGLDSVVTLNLMFQMCCRVVLKNYVAEILFFNGIITTTGFQRYLVGVALRFGGYADLMFQMCCRVVLQKLCSGQSYFFWFNQTTTGIYKDTWWGGSCDSVVTLNLNVSNVLSSSFAKTICSGQSYFFNGINRTATGIYKDTLVGVVCKFDV